MRKLTTEEFIAKAREVHGDKYDYSNVNYVNTKTKVEIICPEHGSFWQSPLNHLSGQGCKQCGIEQRANIRRSSNEDFISRAKEIHGEKYDYSNVNYVNATTKVEIICPEHGSFWQTPNGHINGKGCPKCVGKNKTTEEFIEEAKAVHGDKYDYSKVVYNGNKQKVEIICSIHGSFWQTPTHHLNGTGCPKCIGRYKTTEEFIEEAKAVHGDKYDYSRVNYVGTKTKVEIICPEHGSFWQTPSDHLNGKGCPSCFGNKKYTTEEFIEKVKAVHGNKYDYSRVNYVSTKVKVEIICPIHGSFWQTPTNHLKGNGCPKCIGQNKTTEEFIEEAKAVHGDKYDYSRLNYVGTKTKVEIICPEHGSFWQTPNSHLRGGGCPKCVGRNKTTEEFIEEAKAVHGDKYDYSKVNYVNATTKVEIICPEHGSFWQTPNSHLGGSGCLYCGLKTNILKKDYISILKELQRSDLDLMDDAQLIMLVYDFGFKQCMPLLNTAKSQRNEALSKLLSKLEGEDDEQFIEDDEKTPDTKIAEGGISDIISATTTDDADDTESVRKLQDSISRISGIRMDGEISFEDYKKFCFPNVPKHVFRREVARTWNVFIFPNEGNAEKTIKDELKSAKHFRRMVLEQTLKELQDVNATSIR